LLGSDQGLLSKAQSLISNEQDNFSKLFLQQKFNKVVCYFEFVGSKSFAGSHEIDDVHKMILFDISVENRGFLQPEVFLNLFTNTDFKIPKLLYHGPIDKNFVFSVKNDKLPGITSEGVVAKAYNDQKRTLEMFKIKTNKWVAAVKDKYKSEPIILNDLL
jgi:hypothetical protein